ncbi:MAG: 50S ribosomal protein L29 [candidate division WOR-3 bacterium]
MTFSELTGLATPELEKKLDDTYRELFNLRFQHSTGQLDNTARLKQVRKDIARIETVLRLKALSK